MKAESRFLFPFQGLFEQAFRNFTITPLTDWKRFYNPQFFSTGMRATSTSRTTC